MTPTELRALAAAATPRPWELVPGYERDLLEDMLHADAEYAFAAANAVPDLLDRIEVLEGALTKIAYPALTEADECPWCGLDDPDEHFDTCPSLVARAALEGADHA